MKSLTYLFAGMMLILTGINSHRVTAGKPQEPASGSTAASIKILCTSDMKDLAESWIINYKSTAPSAEFVITEVTEPNIAAPGQISLLNAEAAASLDESRFRKMTIGRDAVVFLCNPEHLLAKEIAIQGMTPDKLALLLRSKTTDTKGNFATAATVRMYISPDIAVTNLLEAYARLDASEIEASVPESSEALLEIIRNDKNAFGIIRLSDITDHASKTFQGGIMIIPVDRNKNGRIDNFEQIYSSPEAFTRGIWTGKYPASLTENIFAVIADGTLEESATGFLGWIFAKGQDNLSHFGFADLSTGEREANLQQLQPSAAFADDLTSNTTSGAWIKILIALLAVSILAYSITVVFRRRRLVVTAENFRISTALSPDTIKAPAGLYYDKSHTWAFMEKDGSVRIGIDDFLQHITGPLTRIKMKESGEKVRKGEKIITLVREGKQLEIYAPVSGTIRQYNEDLLKSSEKLNTSPYTEGWIYTIEPTNWAREIQFMIMGSDYREWLSEEFGRLRDFFALSVNSNQLVYQQVVLQDGGEITDHVLADMGPEVWEDFQRRFIDTSR